MRHRRRVLRSTVTPSRRRSGRGAEVNTRIFHGTFVSATQPASCSSTARGGRPLKANDKSPHSPPPTECRNLSSAFSRRPRRAGRLTQKRLAMRMTAIVSRNSHLTVTRNEQSGPTKNCVGIRILRVLQFSIATSSTALAASSVLRCARPPMST